MIVVGIDEVGRGCWAGPLVAGAVVLNSDIPGLNDSKVLSKKERERLAALIWAEAEAVGLGWVWPEAIDTSGISVAVKQAMTEALAAVTCDYDKVIVDGNINYFPANPKAEAVIRADGTIAAVGAASIVAKVARDTYMTEAANHYPGYGFEKHVGYGTAAHIASIERLGVCDIHRLSYKPIRAFLASHG